MGTEISVASDFVGRQTSLRLKNTVEFAKIHSPKCYILLHFRGDYRNNSSHITKTEQLLSRRCKDSVSFGLNNGITEKLPMRLKHAYELATVKNTESE